MRKIVLYGVIIFQILIIISLIRGIQLSRRSATRIAALQETKAKLQKEQAELKKQGEYVESQFYLEKVAREELHLAKPGEAVVIVPESQRIGESANQQSQKVVEKPIWQKWWEVLSGKD